MPSGGLLLAATFALAGCEQRVVTAADVASVEVSPAEITLVEGDQASASAIPRERGGRQLLGRAVAWSVDDPEVATVASTGLVEGRAPGSTLIHATIENVTGSATVTVLVAPSPPPEPDACVVGNRTFAGDLEIAVDTSCTFVNVRVRGNLVLAAGSALTASDLRVDGNIEARSAGRLTLAASRVDGNLIFEGGGSVDVRGTTIAGNVHLESNVGRLDAEDNRVEGNVQVLGNSVGPFTFSDNRIDGNFRCRDNVPAPTGGGNTVGGNKEDQCRNL